jgi:hypothetical protein
VKRKSDGWIEFLIGYEDFYLGSGLVEKEEGDAWI